MEAATPEENTGVLIPAQSTTPAICRNLPPMHSFMIDGKINVWYFEHPAYRLEQDCRNGSIGLGKFQQYTPLSRPTSATRRVFYCIFLGNNFPPE